MKCAVIGAALLLGACQDQQQFKPGKWATEVIMAAGKSQLWSSKVERCMDFAAGDDPVAGILSTSPLGQCQLVEGTYEGQDAVVRLHCVGRENSMFGGMPEARVSLRGRHSPTSIEGNLVVEPVHEISPGSLSGKLSARRTGDC